MSRQDAEEKEFDRLRESHDEIDEMAVSALKGDNLTWYEELDSEEKMLISLSPAWNFLDPRGVVDGEEEFEKRIVFQFDAGMDQMVYVHSDFLPTLTQDLGYPQYGNLVEVDPYGDPETTLQKIIRFCLKEQAETERFFARQPRVSLHQFGGLEDFGIVHYFMLDEPADALTLAPLARDFTDWLLGKGVIEAKV